MSTLQEGVSIVFIYLYWQIWWDCS